MICSEICSEICSDTVWRSMDDTIWPGLAFGNIGNMGNMGNITDVAVT
jgi:hypothetical protein